MLTKTEARRGILCEGCEADLRDEINMYEYGDDLDPHLLREQGANPL